VELEFAIFVGTILSIGLYLNKTARPRVLLHVPNPGNRQFISDLHLPQCPQFGIIRIDGDLYFAAMNHVESSIDTIHSHIQTQRKILILCRSINIIDLMGVESMINMVKKYREKDVDISFCKMQPEVMIKMQKGGAINVTGLDHIFESEEGAIMQIVANLDKDVCIKCPHRVFWECDANKKWP
jgi:SulP family sulfate permease